MPSLESFFAELPKVTKFYFCSAFLTTVCVMVRVVTPGQLYFAPELIWSKFQLWRLFTSCTFFGPFSMPFCFQLYFLLTYGARYEADPISSGGGPSSDMAYMLMIGATLLWVIAYCMGLPFVGHPLVFMILYVWSRKEAESPMKFFGFEFKGLHLPWVLLLLGVLMGRDPTMDLLGIGVGHLYYFLLVIVPQTYNTEVIKTPSFLINYLEGITVTPTNTRSGGSAQAASTRGHNWGSGGRALGAN